MNIPSKGFYMHYKHTPEGEPLNYMYEVIGIAQNTEVGTYAVLYRPLYANEWMAPADYQARPLEMFMESVVKDGVTVPRFAQITDPELLIQLEAAKIRLYG